MKSVDLEWLYSLTNEYRSIKYDLANMQALLAALGEPHRAFRSVLIAGTNGKGSVARMLSGIIPEAGLYTSPHLIRLNERISIGHREIDDADLQSAFDRVRSAAETAPHLLYPPTYFELVTAMAFCHFSGRVGFAVLEVGLGGRLDATNTVNQDVSVITSIGLDHEQFLGPTLAAIAAEKAGIIKGGGPVVLGPGVDFEAIRSRARSFASADDVDVSIRSSSDGLFEVEVRSPRRRYPVMRPGLRGRHQLDNMRTVILAAEYLEDAGWPVTIDRICEGIETAQWPGRLERIGGRFLLDGAHNPHAVARLVSYLDEFHPGGVPVIFGCMADKDYGEMLRMIDPRATELLFTRPASGRAVEPSKLVELCSRGRALPSVSEAIESARALDAATVVVCGSLYLIGEARRVLQ